MSHTAVLKAVGAMLRTMPREQAHAALGAMEAELAGEALYGWKDELREFVENMRGVIGAPPAS